MALLSRVMFDFRRFEADIAVSKPPEMVVLTALEERPE